MSDQGFKTPLSNGKLVTPDGSRYREVTSKGLKKKYPHPLKLSENPLTVHNLDIAENMFGVVFKDIYQEFECSWVLDIQPDLKDLVSFPRWKRLAGPAMVCEFLCEDLTRLEQKAIGESTLYGTLVTQHYLWMLEKLILFCQEKGTRTLMFIFREKYKNYLEIYRPYSMDEQEVRMRHGKDTYAVLKVSSQTCDAVIENLYKLEQQLRQHLWRYQRGNPLLRSYLKSNPL